MMNKDRAKELIKAFEYFRKNNIPCTAATAFALDCVEQTEVDNKVKAKIVGHAKMLEPKAITDTICDKCGFDVKKFMGFDLQAVPPKDDDSYVPVELILRDMEDDV